MLLKSQCSLVKLIIPMQLHGGTFQIQCMKTALDMVKCFFGPLFTRRLCKAQSLSNIRGKHIRFLVIREEAAKIVLQYSSTTFQILIFEHVHLF